jgi:hypothetical protein
MKPLPFNYESFEANARGLNEHAYLNEFKDDREIPAKLMLEETVLSMLSLVDCVNDLQLSDEPAQVIVGDDVSGRVPTLITRRFLELSHADQVFSEMPRTFFMASGTVELFEKSQTKEGVESIWRDNLTGYAALISARFLVERALIITDLVSTGASIDRLEYAFHKNGISTTVMTGGESVYLLGTGSVARSRSAVGVEKYCPEPTSHRHPESNPEKTRLLRDFVYKYAGVLYETTTGNKPPDLVHFTPTYAATAI